MTGLTFGVSRVSNVQRMRIVALSTGLRALGMFETGCIDFIWILVSGVGFSSQGDPGNVEIVRINESKFFTLVIRTQRTDFLIQLTVDTSLHSLVA